MFLMSAMPDGLAGTLDQRLLQGDLAGAELIVATQPLVNVLAQVVESGQGEDHSVHAANWSFGHGKRTAETLQRIANCFSPHLHNQGIPGLSASLFLGLRLGRHAASLGPSLPIPRQAPSAPPGELHDSRHVPG